MLQAGVIGVSVWGPGLEGWDASRAILAGAAPYEDRPSPPPAPSILASTERRRTGPVV
ncbi:MAG: 3-oxoacyl-ACP synthase, partial [Gemmatimonadaceae bacterium]|nr:3-oxoacyl-ACP synthase [Acetobacteraceae bacterium]